MTPTPASTPLLADVRLLIDAARQRVRSQTVTSNTGRGGRRTAPYALTEQGVAMLSSVLGCPRAIGVTIEIMRTFVCVNWPSPTANWPSG